jgi:hypothetical protein
LLGEEKERQHVLANLEKLVVKAVGESGGYGMLIGPKSTARQREEFARQIEANPRNYIAQPTLDFSRAPCLIGNHLEPRHVDLRPYVLFGDKVNIVPGGLTRLALLVLVSHPFRKELEKDGAPKQRGRDDVIAGCRQLVLDEPLSRARREHRAPARRDDGPDARHGRHLA